MSTRCPKWGTKLKADFRRHIEARRINPNKTDRAYILSIHDRYYKGRPDTTFIENYNASVAEWRIGR
jgi:phosphate-selective porin